MKTEHYPDQKRCETLTSLGFPETELVYCNVGTESHRGIDYDFNSYHILDELYIIPRLPTWRYCSREDYPFDDTKILQYRCPSIAELLDVLPKVIHSYTPVFTQISAGYEDTTLDQENKFHGDILIMKVSDTLPNALSDLVICLTQNGYHFENGILISNK